MKRFIIQILLFIFYSSFTYIFFTFIWGTAIPGKLKKNILFSLGAYGHLYSRLNDVHKIENVDVLFLGSSHAYRGFDTRIFKENKITSFNLGSSGQTPIQTKVLIERYLSKLNPKLIVLEVYPGNFTNDGVESSLDLISNDIVKLDFVKMALTINDARTYNTLIYSSIRQFLNLNKNFTESIRIGKDLYVRNGGYVEREISYYTNTRNKYLNETHWELNKNQKKTFEEIIKTLNELKRKYILVQAPITKHYYNSIKNKKEVDDYLVSCGSYFNFNSMLELNDSLDFYDSHHLNQNGVKKFNELLIKEIKPILNTHE